MPCIPRMPVFLRVMCRMGLEVPWLLEHEERPSGFDVLKALVQSKEWSYESNFWIWILKSVLTLWILYSLGLGRVRENASWSNYFSGSRTNGKGWKRNNCYQKDLCSCFCSIIGGMGLELSSITINYLAVLKTFCVHVLCNLYNLSSLTEMKLFQWRHAVFVLNCWLQPSPRAAPIISWSFASELKVNGDRSSPWTSLDFVPDGKVENEVFGGKENKKSL